MSSWLIAKTLLQFGLRTESISLDLTSTSLTQTNSSCEKQLYIIHSFIWLKSSLQLNSRNERFAILAAPGVVNANLEAKERS